MEELKLLLLEKGDSQKNLIDKVNFNFSQIVSFEGGPYGKIGPEGKNGNRGNHGPTGSFGYQGIRGNLWSLSIDSPVNPKQGDYWMNPDNNNEVKVYNSNTQNLFIPNVNLSNVGNYSLTVDLNGCKTYGSTNLQVLNPIVWQNAPQIKQFVKEP
jgi:hypothetical protein